MNTYGKAQVYPPTLCRPVKIRTGYLANIIPQRYRYANLLGGFILTYQYANMQLLLLRAFSDASVSFIPNAKIKIQFRKS